VVWLWP